MAKKKDVEEEGPVAAMSVKDKIKIALAAAREANPKAIIGTGSDPEIQKWLDYEKVPTGFAALDVILDGGFPKGKYSIVAGVEQSCKTTLLLHTVANRLAARPDAVWAWVDAENSLDKKWAEKHGIDMDRFIIEKPAVMEDLMDTVIHMTGTGALDGIVVDSIGALTPKAELQKKKDDKGITKSMSDDTMAMLARKAGQFFRMANEPVFRTQTACILIGHVYSTMDEYNPYEVKGGNAMKHWGHLRIMSRRRRGDQESKKKTMMPSGQEKDLYLAFEAVFGVDKTRQGAHYGHEVSIPFVYGEGLSNSKSVIDMAFAYNVIEGAGAWFSHSTLPNGKMQGRDNVAQYLTDTPDAFSVILQEVGVAIGKTI